MASILIVSDNVQLVSGFISIIRSEEFSHDSFSFRCSPGSEEMISSAAGFPVRPISTKTQYSEILSIYDLVISLHCKQMFPKYLVWNVRCINVHPGFNPYNRGWFPQVFSILNGLPAGATIHEIDEELDHGKIIAQEEVAMNSWDTSSDVYNRILQKELNLLKTHLRGIISGNYSAYQPEEEGNLNFRSNFKLLCQIDLSEKVSFKQAIDRLRALTHSNYKNAFYYDPETGRKVYVSIQLDPEENND